MVNFSGFGGSISFGLINVLSRNLPGETEEDHEKTVRIDGVPA
jgi:hypothetical protein